MPNEITVVTGLKVNNGNLIIRQSNETSQFDQSSALGSNFTSTISTTEETISFGDVTPGFVKFTNLDDTNFVQLGFVTGDYSMRLLPNKGVALFYLESGTSVFALADTADCNIQIEAFNA